MTNYTTPATPQQRATAEPDIERKAVTGKSGKTEWEVRLWVITATGRVAMVESQSKTAGYIWQGEDKHKCDSRLSVCRHIQAVRQYHQQQRGAV